MNAEVERVKRQLEQQQAHFAKLTLSWAEKEKRLLGDPEAVIHWKTKFETVTAENQELRAALSKLEAELSDARLNDRTRN